MSKRIVTIGGGSGHAQLLVGLRDAGHMLTAIVSTADDGGPNGILAREYTIPPPSDLRKCLLALARDTERAQLWAHRFSGGTLGDYTVGNILLTALAQQKKSMTQACIQAAMVLNAAGVVLPIAESRSELVAVLRDGQCVVGETAIDLRGTGGSGIDHVELVRQVSITPEAREAILAAEYIVFTMGDLFTSVIPNVLIDGCIDALRASAAKRVLICNRSTKPGETDGFSIGDCIATVERYLEGLHIDYCIADDFSVSVPHPYEAFRAENVMPKERLLLSDLHNAKEPHHVDGHKAAQQLLTVCESL